MNGMGDFKKIQKEKITKLINDYAYDEKKDPDANNQFLFNQGDKIEKIYEFVKLNFEEFIGKNNLLKKFEVSQNYPYKESLLDKINHMKNRSVFCSKRISSLELFKNKLNFFGNPTTQVPQSWENRQGSDSQKVNFNLFPLYDSDKSKRNVRKSYDQIIININ